MLSTAAPDFRPGSSLFGPVERRSVTLVPGRLGGVRCGLSGPALVQVRRIGPRVHLWPIGAASGPVGAENPVTLRNLHELAEEAAEALSSEHLDGAPEGRGVSSTGGRWCSDRCGRWAL